MKRALWIVGLAAVLCGATSAVADPVVIQLVGPTGTVQVGEEFQIDIEVLSPIDLAMIQIVFDNLDPLLTVKQIDAPLAGLAFVNPFNVVVMDFFPNTYPLSAPGGFLAGTLTLEAAGTGTFPIDLLLDVGSSSSTAVFDASYTPSWDVITAGDFFGIICVPEPATVGMLLLVAAGSVLSGRRRRTA